MKYHIFVGSTLDDLKNERKEIIRIIMEFGHIPVIADFLDDTVKNYSKLLKKIIEECDYFIALTAHKYSASDGTVLPLITEYSIAERKGIPVLALIIDDKARWKQVKKETDAALERKLNEFKAKLRTGSFQTWQNTLDLCQKTQSLLAEESIVNAQPGWTRTDRTIDAKAFNEFSRLSFENACLRRQIPLNDEDPGKLQDDQKRILKLLALNKVSLSFYYASGESWENTRQFRNIRIFKLLVPELALKKSTKEISLFLGTVLNPDLEKTVRNDYPTPSNSIKKIMTDFAVLNLVRCVNCNDGKADDEIWEITEYGRNLYSVYRIRQLEKTLAKKTEN
ncbi:MAG: DUF4062 domain-containing protein [Treponema sp.]|nr:DUF4062 domain-containing protein [Treponema sp.]